MLLYSVSWNQDENTVPLTHCFLFSFTVYGEYVMLPCLKRQSVAYLAHSIWSLKGYRLIYVENEFSLISAILQCWGLSLEKREAPVCFPRSSVSPSIQVDPEFFWFIARQQTRQSVSSHSQRTETEHWPSSGGLVAAYLTALPMKSQPTFYAGLVSHITSSDTKPSFAQPWEN